VKPYIVFGGVHLYLYYADLSMKQGTWIWTWVEGCTGFKL